MKTWILIILTLTEARKIEPDFEIGEEVSKK
jgi:hypothetical protein